MDITGAIIGVGVGSTIVATVIEFARLSLRITNVPAWSYVATHRWTEAAIVGLAAGLVAFLLDETGKNSDLVSTGSPGPAMASLILAISLAIGFVIAEAVVGVVRPHVAPGSVGR